MDDMIITGNVNHDYHDNQNIAHPYIHVRTCRLMENEELKQSLHLTQLTCITHNFHLVLTCIVDVNFNLDTNMYSSRAFISGHVVC